MKISVVHSMNIWLPQTQTWLYNQIRYLPEEVEFHIICERTENTDQFFLPNIYALSQMPIWRHFIDRALRILRVRHHIGLLVEQAKIHKAQVLHSHFGNHGWSNLKVARKERLKHVVTFYGLDVSYLSKMYIRWRRRYRMLFEEVDRVLCEGPNMAKSIMNLGCPREKIVVHHLGVAIEEIPFKPRVLSPGEPLRVLIAASFREKKGIPYAIEALGRLRNEIPLEISIIGDANEEARCLTEKKKILECIQKNRLQSKVRMLGYQPYPVLLEEAYKHHIFLAPSITASDGDTEGGAPVTITEMIATGMPVVSTVHCDIPEIIKHEVTGFLAAERDVDGLFRNIRKLVNNPNLWNPIMSSGRKFVEREFNSRIQGEKLKKIYIELFN